MIIHNRKGHGLTNTLINKLPVELHIPAYQYCGPGTKLAKRLARGDPGINLLDQACREHDIAYSQNRKDITARNIADNILAEKAWQRFKAKDSSIGEKTAAFAVTSAMKVKSKLGMSLSKNKKLKKLCKKNTGKAITLKNLIQSSKKSMIKSKCARKVVSSALKGAREAIKKAGGRNSILLH